MGGRTVTEVYPDRRSCRQVPTSSVVNVFDSDEFITVLLRVEVGLSRGDLTKV